MRVFHGLAVLGILGFSIGLPLIGAIYIGSFLDDKYGTHPLILIISIILAIVSGYSSIYRLLVPKDKGKK